MKALFRGLLLTCLCACTAEVEVETEPLRQAIQATSIGIDVFAEIAIDIPAEAQGDIVVNEVSADLDVVNPTNGVAMTLSVRISGTGTATPKVPKIYTQATRPPHFDTATVLLGPKQYAGTTRTPEHIEHPALVSLMGRPRLWLIVGNRVNQVSLAEPLPLELVLENVILHAVVTKSFEGLSGGLNVTGL